MDLLLASTSPIRAALLANAGLRCAAVAPGVDEAPLEERHQGSDAELATLLAEAKASSVSRTQPNALVIGGDSVLSVAGRRFGKPADRATAAEHLRFFSGNVMDLTSAVVLALNGEVVWRFAETARLQVRPLAGSFIERYLDQDWPEVSYCVGVFRLEGPGVQLFERIEGDHFTILGLPLLPLLGELRRRGLLSS